MEIHSNSDPKFCQMPVVPSKLAVANNIPEGDQAHDLTVLVCVSSKTACAITIYNENSPTELLG